MALSYEFNIFTGTFDLIDGAGSGDVVGPSVSVDNAIVRFNGTTGKLIQDYTSGAPTISDTGAITATQGGSLTGTWTDLGSVTTIDINGGTIDGLTDHITWGAGAAGVAGDWSVGRNATTVFEFRVPTGNTWAFINQASTVFSVSNTGRIDSTGGAILRSDSLLLGNLGFYFGATIDTSTYAHPFIGKMDTQTNAPFVIGVNATVMYMMILKGGNQGGNYAHAVATNPTLSIYSATAAGSATLEFLDISHNTTNALYHAGKGGHAYTQNAVAGGAGLVLWTPAAHTAMTAEKVDVTLSAHTITLTDTTTIALSRSVVLNGTTFNGAAGGGSEVVTTAVNLEVAAPVQGTNLTITNAPIAARFLDNVVIGNVLTPAAGPTQTLFIGTGTAPTTVANDSLAIYSSDLTAGNTMLSIYGEGTSVASVSPTAQNRTIAVRVNGTVYYLTAKTTND